MHSNLKNLAFALVAGTLALAANAQDKAPEKAPKKAAAAPAGAGRVVVNGVAIPQNRIDAMSKELTAQGQPDARWARWGDHRVVDRRRRRHRWRRRLAGRQQCGQGQYRGAASADHQG